MLKGFWQRNKSNKPLQQATSDPNNQERLGFIGHNLRSPISSILALTESHRLGINKQSIPELLAEIDRFAEHSLRASSQFIDLLRVESLVELDKHPIEANSLLEEAIDSLYEVASNAEVTLVFNEPNASLWIEGQGELLEKALTNLIENAIAYSNKGSQVTLQLDQHNQQTRFHIIDSGCGIDEQDLPKLLTHYQRPKHSSHLNGSGLGLHLVATIAQRHNGQLSLTSQKDQGTHAILALPSISTPI